MTQQQLVKKTARIAEILEAYQGRPRQSKRGSNPLDMLIATLLSQNTNDRNSHRAYENLKAGFPTWEEVIVEPKKKIADAIRVGGMANQKSVRIKKILRSLKQRYGKLSLSHIKKKTDKEIFNELFTLDGVGVKTVACVLLFALKRDVFPVDTHIHRICNRLGLIKTNSPEKTYEEMKPLVPAGKAYSFHVNLIRFGRKVCKSQNPLCGVCPLYDECMYEGKNSLGGLIKRTKPRRKRDMDFMLLESV